MNPSDNKIPELQKKIDEVKGIMQDNVSHLIENMDSLSVIQSKSEDLFKSSKQLKKSSRVYRYKLLCNQFKFNLIALIIVLLFFIFLIVAVIQYVK